MKKTKLLKTISILCISCVCNTSTYANIQEKGIRIRLGDNSEKILEVTNDNGIYEEYNFIQNYSTMSAHYTYKNWHGINNYTYYISPSASSITEEIKQSMSDWQTNKYMDNPLKATLVSSNHGSNCDFYYQDSKSFGSELYPVVLEVKYYESNNERVFPWEQDWFFCNVYLNCDILDKCSATVRTAYISTAVGASLGLCFNDDSLSIMNTDMLSMMVPQAWDIAALLDLYR